MKIKKKLLKSICDLFEAEDHLRYDKRNKRYYCGGHCEVNNCPAVIAKSLLDKKDE